jgi:hypothetical protein
MAHFIIAFIMLVFRTGNLSASALTWRLISPEKIRLDGDEGEGGGAPSLTKINTAYVTVPLFILQR